MDFAWRDGAGRMPWFFGVLGALFAVFGVMRLRRSNLYPVGKKGG